MTANIQLAPLIIKNDTHTKWQHKQPSCQKLTHLVVKIEINEVF